MMLLSTVAAAVAVRRRLLSTDSLTAVIQCQLACAAQHGQLTETAGDCLRAKLTSKQQEICQWEEEEESLFLRTNTDK